MARASVLALVVALLAPAPRHVAAQPADDGARLIRAYEEAETAKRTFTQGVLRFAEDLAGRTGLEGYALVATLRDIESALAGWDRAARTVVAEGARVDTAGAHVIVARVQLDRHRLDDARRAADTAVERDPTRATAYALLGLIHRTQHRPVEAAEAFARAATAAPDEPLYQYEVASAHEAAGRPDDALAARQAFVAAAERALSPLWSRTVRLEGPARTTAENDAPRFTTRQAPIDLMAALTTGPTVFLPAAYVPAARALAAGEFDAAVRALRAGLTSDPLAAEVPLDVAGAATLDEARRRAAEPTADAATFRTLGHAFLAADRGGEATVAFERALSLDPSSLSARLRLGGLALLGGDVRSALTHLEAATRAAPESSEAQRLLAEASLAAGDPSAAAQHLGEALTLAPGDERVATSLQRVLLQATPDEGLLPLMRHPVDAHRDAGLADLHLARFLQNIGGNDEAIEAYDGALAASPLTAPGRLQLRLAELYMQQLAWDRAIETARAALEVDANFVLARALIARLLLEQNQPEASYVEHLAVLLLDPFHAEAHARVAQIALQSGRFDQALRVARFAVTEDPDHAQARYTLGQALVRSGDVDAGRRELAEYTRRQREADAAQTTQRELEALNQQALQLANAGDLPAAVDLLRRAATLDASGEAQAILGLALMQAGRPLEAIEAFEQAVALDGLNPDLRLYLAEAYADVGQAEASARERAAYERLRRGR